MMGPTLNFVLVMFVLISSIAVSYQIDNITTKGKILKKQLDRMKDDV